MRLRNRNIEGAGVALAAAGSSVLPEKPGSITHTTAQGIEQVAAEATTHATVQVAGQAAEEAVLEPTSPPQANRPALPNVLLTPHAGGMTPEVIQTGLAMAVENIENFLQGTPTYVVARPGMQ